MSVEEDAKRLARLVKEGGVTIFSGAGLSTESGLQDFRSRDGIWAHADPTRLASVGALEDNYEEFLEFYKARLYVPEEIQPNIGHKIIAKWEKEGYVDGVITQNVDRLHQKAGSVNVWELHGSLEPVRCHSCGGEGSTADFLAGRPCARCGGRLRPSVVLFGEMLPQRPLGRPTSSATGAGHSSSSVPRSSSRPRTTFPGRRRAVGPASRSSTATPRRSTGSPTSSYTRE